MADYKKMIPWIKKWEGGYANDPDDAGGCTMMGITIKTFQHYYGKDKTCEDLKNITDQQLEYIFKIGFWDKMQADEIKNQSVAELIVQMAWGSGTVAATNRIQQFLGVKVDCVIGPITLWHINKQNPRTLFTDLKDMRKKWLVEISKKGNNKKYLKGWLNRLNDLKFVE